MKKKTKFRTRKRKEVLQRECLGCGKWIPHIKGKARCSDCVKIYNKEYKKNNKDKVKKCKQQEHDCLPKSEHFLESAKVWGLFSGVKPVVKKAMLAGDYKLFMKLTEGNNG